MANIGDIKIVDVNGLPGFSGTSGATGPGGGKDGSGKSSGNLADNYRNFLESATEWHTQLERMFPPAPEVAEAILAKSENIRCIK